MKNEVRYLMSQEQLKRFKVITDSLEGKLTVLEAATSLGLSVRQVKRLRKGVKEKGPGFLIHKNTSRSPQHTIPDEVAQKIVNLKTNDFYKEANLLHFQELLAEHEQISLSYAPLYSILKKAGIESPKKRRRFKPHRRRKRKPQEGLLIQMDGTPYEWFGGKQQFCLHGAIDDATGKIGGLYLTKNECLHGYFEVTRQIIHKDGIPISIYADMHAIFLSRNASKLSVEDQLAGKVVNDTQFGRAMKELGITLIPARSPQAKGRVERLWETLQSRLPIEFKIAGITNIDEANAFLLEYIPKFNAHFAVEPEEAESAYRPLSNEVDLNNVLCIKQKRTLDTGGVFSFYNKHFKVIEDKSVSIPPKAKIEVLISTVFGIRVQYKKQIFEAIPFIKPKKQSLETPKQRKTYKPPDNHYYKYGQSLVNKLTFEDSNSEILKLLEDIFLKKYA